MFVAYQTTKFPNGIFKGIFSKLIYKRFLIVNIFAPYVAGKYLLKEVLLIELVSIQKGGKYLC